MTTRARGEMEIAPAISIVIILSVLLGTFGGCVDAAYAAVDEEKLPAAMFTGTGPLLPEPRPEETWTTGDILLIEEDESHD